MHRLRRPVGIVALAFVLVFSSLPGAEARIPLAVATDGDPDAEAWGGCPNQRNPVRDQDGNQVPDVAVVTQTRCISVDLLLIKGTLMAPLRDFVAATVPSALFMARPREGDPPIRVLDFPEREAACLDASSVILCYLVGSGIVYRDAEPFQLRQGAVRHGGVVYVPVRDTALLLGGSVVWDPEYRIAWLASGSWRAWDLWMDLKGACRFRGYNNTDRCPGHKFIAGYQPYYAFGRDWMIELTLDGVFQDPAMIAFVNRHGALRAGRPAREALAWKEALTQAGIDLALLLWIGYTVPNVPRPVTLENMKVPLPGRLFNYTASAAQRMPNGWHWFTRNGVSTRALNYQTRVANTAYEVRAGRVMVREYAHNQITFDGMEAAGRWRVFVDAKSDSGFLVRLLRANQASGYQQDLAQEMVNQFMALRKESYIMLEWRVETEVMKDFVNMTVERTVPSLLIESLGEAEGRVALAQLKEILRVVVVE